MPTDQHAATGTCELGDVHIVLFAPPYKIFLQCFYGLFVPPLRAAKTGRSRRQSEGMEARSFENIRQDQP